jgi:L-aminopeptidase/D-esterase-like protein
VIAVGPSNAITDVPGVLVGHFHRREAGWAAGAVGAVDGRGGAPGTRETDLLDPVNLVQRAHAVCLTGGSAYGLAAADGVMRWLAERNRGFRVGPAPHEVVPIVPAAVLFDLPQSAWGNRPDADFGYAACESASGGVIGQGSVGAGAGARLGSLAGGVGTASAVLPDDSVLPGAVVGALAVANAVGEAVDLATGLPFAADLAVGAEFGVRWPDRPADLTVAAAPRLHTTIGVVAVDAELSKAECRRIAMAAQDGLARAIRPAHTLFDGDTVFALATGDRPLGNTDLARAQALDALCTVAADVFARAIVHALLTADPLPELPAYRTVWP